MDLNAINASVNRLLTNIWAVISFLREFAVDGAKDVSITYINADGSESVKTFPNISKMWETFNITNDNGVIRDLNGKRLNDFTFLLNSSNLGVSMSGGNTTATLKTISYTRKVPNSIITVYVNAIVNNLESGHRFAPSLLVNVGGSESQNIGFYTHAESSDDQLLQGAITLSHIANPNDETFDISIIGKMLTDYDTVGFEIRNISIMIKEN